MLSTPICERLGIRVPIVLAGMGGVSMHRLVAAVSNAGGLGVIGAATLDAHALRDEIRKTRALTDRPFAVDLLAPNPDAIRPHMRVIFDEDVKIFVAGLAVPQSGRRWRKLAVDDSRFVDQNPAARYRGACFRECTAQPWGGDWGEPERCARE